MNNDKYGYDTIVAEKEAIARIKIYAKDHGIKMYRVVGSAINEYLDRVSQLAAIEQQVAVGLPQRVKAQQQVNNYEERKGEIPLEAGKTEE
jgi:hypothetical protein